MVLDVSVTAETQWRFVCRGLYQPSATLFLHHPVVVVNTACALCMCALDDAAASLLGDCTTEQSLLFAL